MQKYRPSSAPEHGEMLVRYAGLLKLKNPPMPHCAATLPEGYVSKEDPTAWRGKGKGRATYAVGMAAMILVDNVVLGQRPRDVGPVVGRVVSVLSMEGEGGGAAEEEEVSAVVDPGGGGATRVDS